MHTQAEPARYRENLPSHGANRTDIPVALTALLPDMFALCLKTKNFHWHVSGPHFRGYHSMLDEQATQILGTTDAVAQRVRKLGGPGIAYIGHISRLRHTEDKHVNELASGDRLAELLADNRMLADQMAKTHSLCDETGDIASASLIEAWIDEAQDRSWFLQEAAQRASASRSQHNATQSVICC